MMRAPSKEPVMTSFRIALVQPITAPPPDDERNVAACLAWIGRAAQERGRFRLLS
jgi:hypothetical protein